MKGYIIGFILGITFIWLLSKIYLFRNRKDWIKFKKMYNSRKW